MNNGLAQYQQVNTSSAVEGASPHRLIQMLMDGVLQRLAEAKGAMRRNAVNDRGEAIGKAISIIGGLRDSLNQDVDSDVTRNLNDLYAYMTKRLMEANLHSSEEAIDEVMALMRTVKSGWDEIAAEVN